jgi:putative tributyrin esterase
MKTIFLNLLCAALLCFAPNSLFAQQAAPAPKVEAQTNSPFLRSAELNSKLMGRKMPYQVIVPASYESEKSARFPVLYLLHGLGGHYDNWASKTKLTDYSVNHRTILVMPEGENGWYTDSNANPNNKYESYIVGELVQEIDKNFRTIGERRGRAIAGFGAIKFGVKYPQMFALAASTSGAVASGSYRTLDDLPSAEYFKKPILAAFGEPGGAAHKENDLFLLIGEMPAEKIAALPFLYLDCGTEDPLRLLAPNQQLAQIFVTKKIPHEFRQLPGKHDWAFWNSQVQEILRLSERIFAANNKQ